MFDPLTAATVGAGLHVIGRLTAVYGEVKVLRAHTELARVLVELPPGTEITGTGRGGLRWSVRVPMSLPVTAAGDSA